MSFVVRLARGADAMALATAVLQRARLADPLAGVWEAADVQWWSCKPRASDAVDQVFWSDDDGPVAGVLLTAEPDGWQCDVLSVPGAGPTLDELWSRTTSQLDQHARGTRVAVPCAAEASELVAVVEQAGFVPAESDSTGWLAARDRPRVRALPSGFRLVDRVEQAGTPHPMERRNGGAVDERLRRCSLHDPVLDLAVETTDGSVAGYSAYWADPVTGVGLVEPVRVEDQFARRGLATAMLTVGIDRLAVRGATRVKVSWSSEAAGALYTSVGFGDATRTTWWGTTWP